MAPEHPDLARFLVSLADGLCDTLAAGGRNALLHVAADGDGVAVGTLDLGDDAPCDLLVGTVAPDEWLAVGVATRGWARPLEEADAVFTDPGRTDSERTDVVVLVPRDGPVVSRLRLGATTLDDPPSHGLTLDCLQRTLGLPTAPPLVPTGHVFASMWLANVARVGREMGGSFTWAQACALHPATRLTDDGPRRAARTLVPAARALERACDWDRLRWLVVEGSWQPGTVSPTEAAWFDAGSFCRWVMDQTAPVDHLIDEIRTVARPAIVRRCLAVLDQLHIAHGRGRSSAA